MNKSKGITINEFHSLDALRITEYELPEMAEDMLEIKVHFCGINFADLYTIHAMKNVELPFMVGIECSGIVIKAGAKTESFKVGDKVICYNYNGGMHSEIVRTHFNKCYHVPDNIDLLLAAAIFVNYLTAWFSLFSIGNLKRHQTIFISSCAGGVGLAATELVKHLLKDVTIYGTASSYKRNFVQEQGVKFVKYEELDKVDSQFDLVLESISNATRNILIGKLQPFGKCVIIGAKDLILDDTDASNGDHMINPVDLIIGNKVVAGLHLGILADNHTALVRDTLAIIFRCISENGITPLVKVYSFSDVKAAYQELAGRKNIGKLLLKV